MIETQSPRRRKLALEMVAGLVASGLGVQRTGGTMRRVVSVAAVLVVFLSLSVAAFADITATSGEVHEGEPPASVGAQPAPAGRRLGHAEERAASPRLLIVSSTCWTCAGLTSSSRRSPISGITSSRNIAS
jgi:hypothetical protein